MTQERIDDVQFSEERFSKSERKGIALLTENDLLVYSVGISTGGIAEMKMAMGLPERKVVGTTIDKRGLDYAREVIEKYGLTSRVPVKFEEVSRPLPYEDNEFDFIYARLVLHYLSRRDLDDSLTGLYRILKPDKKIFVVVRSTDCKETKWPDSEYDPGTGFTHITYTHPVTKEKTKARRYFHTEESITGHLMKAGFKIDSTESYEEQLYVDFERKTLAPELDQLIEVIASKVKV